MGAFLTGDPDVNALYVSFSSSDIAETVRLAEGVFLDVDAEGKVVGIEVLSARADLLARLPLPPGGSGLPALLASRVA